MHEAVIFDLDGTLVDTLADIAFAMNQVLEELKLPVKKVEEYKDLVGNGIRELARLSLPDSIRTDPVIQSATNRVMELYSEYPVKFSLPYLGIANVLARLSFKGVHLAVLSNKPQILVSKIIQAFFPDINFSEVIGEIEGIPKKPDPASALAIAEKLRIRAENIIFAGDSEIDMLTAYNAGMIPLAVSWGYRSVAVLKSFSPFVIVDKVDDLERVIALCYNARTHAG